MKCNVCGEQCKANQAFCLKCGSPISVVPDFNLIEQELANSIGEVMDTDSTEAEASVDNKKVNFYGATRNIDIHDQSEFSQNEDSFEDELSDEDDEDSDDNNEVSDEDIRYIKRVRERKQREQERKKKLIIIAASVLAAIVIIVLVIVFTAIGNNNSFASHYNQANTYITEKNYNDAEKELKEAYNLAGSIEEKIKAKEALYNLYLTMGVTDTDKLAAVVNDLLKLDPNNSKYLEWANKYSALKPVADVASGTYDKDITVKLSVDDGKIYYTLDGTVPSKSSTEYKEPIEINTEGETILKAVSIKDGKTSEIVEYKYTIQYSKLAAPKVTPEGGTYTTDTKITVEVPTDCKAYYTYDGSIPTENSTEYTEPISMQRGNNIFSVIIVSKSGAKSSVVSNVYNLDVAANLSYSDAENKLINSLISQGVLSDKSGNKNDGGKMTFSYAKTEMLSNKEYYVINAYSTDSVGNSNGSYYYGVNTSDGSIVTLNKTASGAYSIK